MSFLALVRVLKTEHIVMGELDQLWVPEVKDWRLNERHYGDCIGEAEPLGVALEASGVAKYACGWMGLPLASKPRSFLALAKLLVLV